MNLIRFQSIRRVVRRFTHDCLQFRIRSIIISLIFLGAVVIIYVLARPHDKDYAASSGKQRMRLVHLDLKGAAPKVSYLKQVFPLFAKWGATGLLIEYEDAFPYKGELETLRSKNAYSEEEIKEILSAAHENKLEVMPLVQTFGHFEFVLKHDKFRYLREIDQYPNALCPSKPDSFKLVQAMLDQVMQLHPDVRFFHIGSDEVWHLGMCSECEQHMRTESMSKDQIFIDHVHKVASYLKDNHHIQPIMWDDMFRHFTIKELRDSKMAEVVEPMVWQYTPDLDSRLPQNLFSRYSQVFNNVWAASAFKGATGPNQIVTDIRYHLSNHVKWLSVMAHAAPHFQVFRGFVLTGWQRYDHYAVLCELLPVALPSLAVNLQTLAQGSFSESIHRVVSNDLGLHGSDLLELSPTKAKHHHAKPATQPPDALHLSYPGSDLYTCMQNLHALRRKLAKILDGQEFLAGFNPYLVKHSYTNPYSTEHWLPTAQQLYSSYHQLTSELRQAMGLVYDSDTVDEFYEEHIAEDMNKLRTLIEQAEAQVSVGARVKDYQKV